jgi:hypothetical protein
MDQFYFLGGPFPPNSNPIEDIIMYPLLISIKSSARFQAQAPTSGVPHK